MMIVMIGLLAGWHFHFPESAYMTVGIPTSICTIIIGCSGRVNFKL